MHRVGRPASELFNVLLWCGVFLSSRCSPSKSHNLAKNKTKKQQSIPLLLFAGLHCLFSCFDSVALQLSLLSLLFYFLLFFFFISAPSRLLQRSHEVEVCRGFYRVWGRAPASEVSAASWRCECIRVCLICGITAEGLRGGKGGQVGRGRGGRYKRADIVLATSTPSPSPVAPALKNSSTRPIITPEPAVSFSAITWRGERNKVVSAED